MKIRQGPGLLPVIFLLIFASCGSSRPVVISENPKVPLEQPDPVKEAVTVERAEPVERATPIRLPIRSDQPEDGSVLQNEAGYISIVSSAPDPGVKNVYPGWKPDPVEKTLSGMSLRDRIGQRFIIWLRLRSEVAQVKALIRSGKPAGILVFPENFKSYDEVAELMKDLKKTAAQNNPAIQLLLCVDQEGGRVSALPFRETFEFPAPFFWSQYDDPVFISSSSYLAGSELKKLGINMNFAPVLDLYGKPDASVIGDRSMGSDPGKVAVFAGAYVNGHLRAGVIPVAKHFPGHGVTIVDTHKELPFSAMTEPDLFSRDLIPFKAAIDAGVPAIMTSHILFTKLDPNSPASFSPVLVRNILREKLGFAGVVITDALEMAAVAANYRLDTTLIRMVKAGVDIALVAGQYNLNDMITLLEQAVKSGKLTEEEINEGTRRVLSLKNGAGLLPRRIE